jgi:hypothetical protein
MGKHWTPRQPNPITSERNGEIACLWFERAMKGRHPLETADLLDELAALPEVVALKEAKAALAATPIPSAMLDNSYKASSAVLGDAYAAPQTFSNRALVQARQRVADAHDAARKVVEDFLHARRKQAAGRRSSHEIMTEIVELVAELLPAGEPSPEVILDMLAK